MSQFGECLVYEWGLWFFLVLAALFVLGLGLLLFLAWFFGFRGPARGVDQIDYQGFTVRGKPARIIVVGAVIIGVAALLYWGYGQFRNSFAVSFDTASGPPAELEMLRNKFQSDTQATITVRDRAKKFLVSGKFEGACVEDLFKSICRHYNGQLACDASMVSRRLAIDIK